MVSRLDRLFILLDTGSNESIRLAAARQLGEVQRIQPGELDYLLDRLKEYSSKPVWETRIAAGHAIKHILEHVPPWPSRSTNHDQARNLNHELLRGLIAQEPPIEQILKDFKLDDVIKQCPSLLSDILQAEDSETISNAKGRTSRANRGRAQKSSSATGRRPNKEQLQRQRQLINKELGISMVDSLNLGVKSTDIISNDDLQANYVVDSCDNLSSEKDTGQIVLHCTSNYTRMLDVLNESTNNARSEGKTEKSSEESDQIISTDIWPLDSVVKNYERDLFNPSWEVRHGSAVALREIMRIHGKFAGRIQRFPDDINDHLNQLWLVDAALKSLCVLALDRFGDFLFDQVVAPVRENAAQLLGCCIANLTKNNTDLIIEIMLGMLSNPCWEIRHGGILGLKYSLNVLDRLHVKEIIHYVFGAIFKCLADNSDDVSAEAAASLVPVKDLLLETIPEEAPKLIKFLWEHLVDLDELTASTSNIILLLASLITTRSTRIDTKELVEHIPRLWPLMSHSSTSVRISVLKALTTLTELQESPCSTWMPCETLSHTLRLIFQRSILENVSEIQPHLEAIWLQLVRAHGQGDSSAGNTNLLQATSQFLNYWLCLTMQPSSSPIDRGNSLWLNIRPDGTVSDTKPDGEVHIGSSTFNAETIEQQRIDITICRVLGTKLLGALFTNLVVSSEESQYSKETLKYLSDMLVHYLSTKSAHQRMVSGWAIESWAFYQSHLKIQTRVSLPEPLSNQLKSAIQETSLCYDELATAFTRIQQEARDFVASLDAASIKTNLPSTSDRRMIYNLNQIQYMCDLDIKNELERAGSKKPTPSANSAHDLMNTSVYTTLVSKKVTLAKSYQTTMSTQKSLAISTLSSLSRALISWEVFPAKLRFLIDPLLDSIEGDYEMSMQQKSAEYLVKLLEFLCCNQEEHNSTTRSIIGRLIDSLFMSLSQSLTSEDRNTLLATKLDVRTEQDCCKILMLDSLQRKAEQSRNLSRRQSSVGSGLSLKRSLSQSSTNEVESSESASDTFSRQKANDMKQQGVVLALKLIVRHYGDELPTKLPILWQPISTDLKSQIESYNSSSDQQSIKDQDLKLIKDLTVLQAVGQDLHASLQANLFDLFRDLIHILKSPNPLIRHQICRCIGMISKINFPTVDNLIQGQIIPMMDSNEVVARCGAVEAIAFIIEYLDLELVPKIDTFIVNVLRRMSDQNDQVRIMATHCFGKLLSLMPLNHDRHRQSAGDDLVRSSAKSAESEFVEQLLDPKKLKNFEMPFRTSVLLRSYQQDGLNWLAFLNRFNLHGILCDEMGLGKTFMTICIVAADHFNQLQALGSVNCFKRSPSLIVCPPTLVEHWLYEVRKFVPAETVAVLNPVAYGGNVNDRSSIKNSMLKSEDPSKKNANLIVTSYDVLRNDIEFFKSIRWNYCVLDEGHIIKNGKTKLFKAIKQISAGHRLILSGTPIQNNVTELWSLFDFLMPGFLGSERQFNSRYTKPILQSREHKCSPRDMEAGALAMESLHRQVLPFILRRLKDDVLDDLPPKIIQDYHCELSQLQSKLYEDFTQGKLCSEVTKRSIDRLTSDDTDVNVRNLSKNHVFQALQYLKGVCNHPKLVLTAKHSQYNTIKKYLEKERSSLDDINHSSKLRALKQLLIDCGIGLSDESQQTQVTQPQAASIGMESIVNQHRALIFCQLRSMVNIIENDLLKKHLPNITYLKLDGSVQTNQRQAIVSRFNNDPSIDVLLLTTQIGGLGLNLTGADTVIFVEHDWNPTRDLQAMDRAHRIGQKKVVNVYRLITKDTLEEKIMGLQKFKTMVSSAVINQDNTGLGSMNVEQLFDLFEKDSGNGESKGTTGDRRSALDLLPDLWDEKQYETEYDLDNFVSTLKS